MKKITLKDIGLYAVMGLLTMFISTAIMGFVFEFPSRLLPLAVQQRVANNVIILLNAVIYPLLWSRRQSLAMMRGESGTDEKVLVKRFMREYILPQVTVQFAMFALICICMLVTKQTSAVSTFEMCMWSLAIPFPLLLSCRIVARRKIRGILEMREKGSR